MSKNTITLSDEAFKRLGFLADELNVLRMIDIENPDITQDWFVDLLYKISQNLILEERYKRFHRRNRATQEPE